VIARRRPPHQGPLFPSLFNPLFVFCFSLQQFLAGHPAITSPLSPSPVRSRRLQVPDGGAVVLQSVVLQKRRAYGQGASSARVERTIRLARPALPRSFSLMSRKPRFDRFDSQLSFLCVSLFHRDVPACRFLP
jgi:hypothetical protein